MATLINLLPEVRQTALRESRQRKLVTTIGTLTGSISLGIVILLWVITAAQGYSLKNIQKDINAKQAEIKTHDKLPEILTVQAHLDSLVGLYSQRVLMTQFFSLLPKVSPQDFGLSSMDLDASNNLKVSGRARNYSIVDKFVKSLQASRSDTGANFSNVVITAVTTDGDGKATFSLSVTLSSGVTNGR